MLNTSIPHDLYVKRLKINRELPFCDTPVCARKQKMAHPVLKYAFLEPAATAAMHCHPAGEPPSAGAEPIFKMDCAD